jgi:hypothetical protein
MKKVRNLSKIKPFGYAQAAVLGGVFQANPAPRTQLVIKQMIRVLFVKGFNAKPRRRKEILGVFATWRYCGSAYLNLGWKFEKTIPSLSLSVSDTFSMLPSRPASFPFHPTNERTMNSNSDGTSAARSGTRDSRYGIPPIYSWGFSG